MSKVTGIRAESHNSWIHKNNLIRTKSFYCIMYNKYIYTMYTIVVGPGRRGRI